MANDEFKSDIIDVQVKVKRTTDRAVICERLSRPTPSACFPLSLVEVAANEDGQTHTLSCPEWKLRQAGWL